MIYNLNGNSSTSLPLISAHSRAFKYGDGIFESMLAIGHKIRLEALHHQRMIDAAKALKIQLPPAQFIWDSVNETLSHFNATDIIRLRLTIWRESEGFYTPQQNKASFLIEASVMESTPLPNPAIYLGIYTEILKPINILSAYKTLNSLVYVMAGIYKQEHGYDDCIVLNTNNAPCEVVSSNLFWTKESKLYTPSIECGCIAGTMRHWVIQTAAVLKKEVVEGSYTLDDVRNADEIFITNAIQGITSVKQFEDKKYIHHQVAMELTRQLQLAQS
jgi:branched-chain amino acid aminotransferase